MLPVDRNQTKPERNKGNEALREIAGRIKALSYRDMHQLEKLLVDQIEKEDLPVAEALLFVADILENA
jgi:hypothetical protein